PPQVLELLFLAQPGDVVEGGAEIGAAAPRQLEVVHQVDQFVLGGDKVVPLDLVVGLDDVQVHPAEKALPLLEQGVCLGQTAAHQRPGGRIAGVDDQRDLLDLFALPRFHRLDQGHIAVDRQAVGVKIQIKGVGVEAGLLPQDAEPAQKIPVAAAAAVGGLDRKSTR